MSVRLLVYLLGQVAILSGVAALFPLLYALWHGSAEVPAFVAEVLLVMTLGEVMLRVGREHPQKMDLLDAAGVLVFLWPFASVLGALPFWFSGALDPVEAMFESVSSITSTGISLLPEPHPFALEMWRSLIAWGGSLAFIVLLVTVLPPVCGSFGLVLTYEKSLAFSPLLPRMTRAAIRASRIYVCLTVFSTLLFWLAGLGPLDSLAMAMMSLSTGGGAGNPLYLSRQDPWLEVAAMVSMLMASTSFVLYWQAVRRRDWRNIWKDYELRVFLLLLAVVSLMVGGHLWYTGTYNFADSMRYALFEVISFSSTSGFMVAPVADWPDFDRFVLLLLVFVGGCIGSMTGGMKIKRFLILFRMAFSEMKRTLHPHMVMDIRLGGETISMRSVTHILCYFFVHLVLFYIFAVLLTLSDITLPEAVGLSVGMMSSVGTASGLYGLETFTGLSAGFKATCCLFMLIGRMEIFALMLWFSGRLDRAERRW
ncbi:MAG: TrkH family potassium uptake protein [Schwartzia sp.]|nr:TrkH family potassium uptake protein [Schwartzia sp. (in: firmicutes)]